MRSFIKVSHLALIVAASSAALLAGCSGFTANREAVQKVDEFKAGEMMQAQAMLKRQTAAMARTGVVEEVGTSFIGRNQIAAPKSTQWPPALRKNARINMAFAENKPDSSGNVVVPLSDFAQQVYQTTGIPVRVKPDALRDAAGQPVFVLMKLPFTGSIADLQGP